jgi:hypothetical protein
MGIYPLLLGILLISARWGLCDAAVRGPSGVDGPYPNGGG